VPSELTIIGPSASSWIDEFGSETSSFWVGCSDKGGARRARGGWGSEEGFELGDRSDMLLNGGDVSVGRKEGAKRIDSDGAAIFYLRLYTACDVLTRKNSSLIRPGKLIYVLLKMSGLEAFSIVSTFGHLPNDNDHLLAFDLVLAAPTSERSPYNTPVPSVDARGSNGRSLTRRPSRSLHVIS
jgi:hypothetical protein